MNAVLELREVSVDLPFRAGLRRRPVRVVNSVSLAVRRGEAVGLVGESGCGKSTLARAIVGLLPPADGEILLDGSIVVARRPARVRRRVQLVYQDPGSSLDPRHSVERILTDPLRLHRLVERGRERRRVLELLELVDLPARLITMSPASLSGGQRQRVAIARAIAAGPDVIVADEAVAALDASAAGTVLNVFDDLRRELDLAIVFISHDLSVVRATCDQVAVMYLGQIIESGRVEAVFTRPGHPYTRALLQAVPRIAAALVEPPLRGDEAPSMLEVPAGCRFHPRCPRAENRCEGNEPADTVRGTHHVRCHLAWESTGSSV